MGLGLGLASLRLPWKEPEMEASRPRRIALMTRSDAVFEAWLGPGYRVTAQTNIVKPGGRAQQPHRDYREALHRYRHATHH